MANPRKLILSRIEALLADVPATIMGQPASFATVARNRSEFLEAQRPALVLLDGGETVGDEFLTNKRPSTAPRIVTMNPQIGIVIGGREPLNEMIGDDLIDMQTAVIKAVATDAALLALLGANGGVQYAGMVSDLTFGDTRYVSMEGVAFLAFAITYVLRISQL